MEAIHYLRALGRSWFIVVIVLIVGGVGGYFLYHRATPLYRSAVRMIVSGTGNGHTQNEITARALAIERGRALAQVAATPAATTAAVTAAGYPNSAPAVSAISDPNGPFITLTVTDTSPERAQAVANAFAGVLPRTLVKLEGPNDTPISLTNLASASFPGAPYSPSLHRDLGVGLGVGLLLGATIALFREVLDRTVRDSDELARITQLTVLGTVPKDLPRKLLPASTDPRSARAEGYRQIRTTLVNLEGIVRTLAVTSASVGEGKTSVATNLAAVFSRAGHRVAIVDADLRRPRVAAVFGMSSTPGLADVLARRTSLAEALTVLDDGRLAVLTSGTIPANPSEALGGAAMKEVLDELAAGYEYVFIDTPPVLPVTDALVVAPRVDGVVLVTRLGRTTRGRIKRAQTAVGRVNATMIGVVPNRAGNGTDREYRAGYKYCAPLKKDDVPVDIAADRLQPPSAPAPPHLRLVDALEASPSPKGFPGANWARRRSGS